MRIAMVSIDANPLSTAAAGPAEDSAVRVADLSAALTALGHDVVVHARRDSADAPELVPTRYGYTVFQVHAGPPDAAADLDAFTRALHARWSVDRPDVVHAHGWTAGLASVLAARRLDVPVVQSFHGLGVLRQRLGAPVESRRVGTERLVAREVAGVLAAHTDELEDLVHAGVPRPQVTVVPHGVDVERFAPEGPAAGRRLPRRVLSVADLRPGDGVDDVITALRGMPDTELVVVGRPIGGHADLSARVEQLRAHATRCGAADRVRLVGPVPRAAFPALLRSADVLATVPDEAISTGVALEAMACGVPVVATPGGGLADVVVDGVTGLLVPHADTRALAHALRPLLADHARRDAYGTAGADRVASRYATARVAQDAERAYLRVTGEDEVVLHPEEGVDAPASQQLQA
ncbi:glycosyltransferase [Saccharothrix longispora]|uniref:Glycosyltransferase involved in cell wall biosynthesis n=1 Tax=Saccharothrix longispora TaxID=33920 RepID=A0ABU1PQG1_9PSEU|nr:glycosyltransferase [Saccharothrix longispora]MDR6592906.1 glycosyltransferase involved in cell wall biosynthesis [Saccharothrix longispora]